ncbi:hypothetical protein [Pseudomonas batumici]|uniref:Uncharacterized protein n=1 Tax=Pseudomonas batumici TaxID=226910 RepID=A0A0C2IG05_9PSED|nr:hypothetical protein [Pseudomonas batumici]KIH83832.1 hypothetical protein UCMB321_2414 [Pseudomonas batumici]
MLSSSRLKENPPARMPGGHALGIADWLCLAATPTFAGMALLTAAGAGTDLMCSSLHGTFAFDGMVTMYLIMGAFHLPPWLRLISGHAGGSTG